MSNEIKRSIDDIEIPEGAEERMYANILKKASAQKKPDIKMYRGICLAAACAAGFDVTLPENAEVQLCVIWDETSADVRFTLDGHLYYYSISEADGDFSGVYGSVAESSDISENAVLDVTDEGYFKAHWSGEKYNYYLCNTDGTDRDEVIKTVLFMAEQAE